MSTSAHIDPPRRRRWWSRPLAAVVVLLLACVVEVVVLVVLVHQIGPWSTLGVVVLASLLGAAVVSRQGPRTWRQLREALRVERLQDGRLPGVELLDGALVLLGGVLLLVPGVVSDVLGVLCLLPFVRPLLRGVLLAWVSRRAAAVARRVRRAQPGRGHVVGGEVVSGEVVDDRAPRSSRAEAGRPVIEPPS